MDYSANCCRQKKECDEQTAVIRIQNGITGKVIHRDTDTSPGSEEHLNLLKETVNISHFHEQIEIVPYHGGGRRK